MKPYSLSTRSDLWGVKNKSAPCLANKPKATESAVIFTWSVCEDEDEDEGEQEDEDEDGSRGGEDAALSAACCCWWVTVATTTVTMAPTHTATVAIKHPVLSTEPDSYVTK